MIQDSFNRPLMRASVLGSLMHHFSRDPELFEEILEQQGLARDYILDPKSVITFSDALAIFDTAARRSGDPMLGARLGQESNPADLGPTGLVMLHSATIRMALVRMALSIPVHPGTAKIEITEHGPDALSFSFGSRLGDPERAEQAVEFLLSLICHLIRLGFDPSWSPREVQLMTSSEGRGSKLESFFEAPVRFGCPLNRLVMSSAGVDRVHRPDDPTLTSVIERHLITLEHQNTPLRVAPGFVDEVETLIRSDLGQRPVTLDTIAAQLDLTPRSLQRRLAEEDTTLRDILQIVRISLADKYLADPDMTRNDVARALGYSDSTAFWRAYRSWKAD